VAVRVSRVRQLVDLGDARARVVQQLLGQLDRVVSGVQVGITASPASGWARSVSRRWRRFFGPCCSGCPAALPRLWAYGAALALAFAMLTILHVVIGELVPKTISSNAPSAPPF